MLFDRDINIIGQITGLGAVDPNCGGYTQRSCGGGCNSGYVRVKSKPGYAVPDDTCQMVHGGFWPVDMAYSKPCTVISNGDCVVCPDGLTLDFSTGGCYLYGGGAGAVVKPCPDGMLTTSKMTCEFPDGTPTTPPKPCPPGSGRRIDGTCYWLDSATAAKIAADNAAIQRRLLINEVQHPAGILYRDALVCPIGMVTSTSGSCIDASVATTDEIKAYLTQARAADQVIQQAAATAAAADNTPAKTPCPEGMYVNDAGTCVPGVVAKSDPIVMLPPTPAPSGVPWLFVGIAAAATAVGVAVLSRKRT